MATKEEQHTSEFTFRMAEAKSLFAKKYPGFVDELTKYVNESPRVTNNAEYSSFLRGITELVVKHKKAFMMATPMFDREIKPVGSNELTIKTGWGGVSFKEVSVKRNHVEKLLIAGQAEDPSGVLGFEYHHKKDEHLELLEGLAIFMLSDHGAKDWIEGQVMLTLAQPGDTATIHPESEHGVIPLTKVVILETSTCDLDASDLLFIFQPA